MVVRHEPWAPGTPAWVDLSTSNLDRSQRFYAAVLGWDFTESQEQVGGYVNATLNGELVAGMAPPMDGTDQWPHVWTTYVATADSGATAQAVTEAGGTVLLPAMQVGPLGTMALYRDATGTVFGSWEAGRHTGCTIANEAGSMVWNEAMVGDFEAGKAFYATVFGYRYDDMSGPDWKYATFSLDGDRPSGGIGQVGADSPGPHWAVTFAVEDTDAVLQAVRRHGGTVQGEPEDTEYGRIGTVAGPDGEPFHVMGPTADGARPADPATP